MRATDALVDLHPTRQNNLFQNHMGERGGAGAGGVPAGGRVATGGFDTVARNRADRTTPVVHGRRCAERIRVR